MNLERLFAYDHWANTEEVRRLRECPAAPKWSLRILGHIVAAERLWIARLTRTESPLPVWPDMTLDEIAAELDPLRNSWAQYLASAPLDSKIAYRNTKGEEHTSRVDDVLMHVILHGTYHRGQIASDVRGSGETPPVTDYIHCTRLGLIG